MMTGKQQQIKTPLKHEKEEGITRKEECGWGTEKINMKEDVKIIKSFEKVYRDIRRRMESWEIDDQKNRLRILWNVGSLSTDYRACQSRLCSMGTGGKMTGAWGWGQDYADSHIHSPMNICFCCIKHN
jgi:hypothetical protein